MPAAIQIGRRSFAALGLVAAAAPIVGAWGRIPAVNETAAGFDTLLRDAAASYGTIGYSVAVLRRGKQVHVRHAGLADRETGVAVSDRSVYRIYSVSKLFLLVALFQAVEARALDLDMPIGAIRPNLPKEWRSITLRQAISHLSGLPDYMPDNIAATADGVFAAISNLPLIFSPGTRNAYNQTNFLLAKEALERSGTAFTAQVQRQFTRAGMTDTRYRLPGERIEAMVTSYRPVPDRRAPPTVFQDPDFPAYTFGSGGTVTTLSDMVRWTQALVGGAFVPLAALRGYWEPQRSASGAAGFYAHGWEYERYGPMIIVGHSGGGRVIWRHFFRADDPDDSVTVIYFDNGGRTPLDMHRLTSLLAEQLLPGAARPTAALEEELLQRLARGQWDANAVTTELDRRRSLGDREIERAVNRVGYDALFMLGAEAALLPFRLNTVRFAASANTHDSLGEAYRATGDLKASRASYVRAHELDPNNAQIAATLAELDAAMAAAPLD